MIRFAFVTLLAAQLACVKPPPVSVYRMGDKVQVGPLIYNVFEAKWLPQIGEGPEARTPAHRFLILHLMVVNGGAETQSVQSFQLVDASGQVFQESIEGKDVPHWLGIVRNVRPADTLDGSVVFDVEPKTYKLRLDDGSGSGGGQMVELPLQFEVNKSVVPNAFGTSK
jgi:Telomeric repeat-binding factor 2.